MFGEVNCKYLLKKYLQKIRHLKRAPDFSQVVILQGVNFSSMSDGQGWATKSILSSDKKVTLDAVH